MNPNKNTRPRYEVLAYDGQAITSTTVTREQVMAINRQSVDHFMCFASNVWAYRTADGEWIANKTDWKGLGDTCLKIIETVQYWPGQYLTPIEVSELTGIFSLREPNNLSARLAAIRRAHGEGGRKPKRPNFFLSKRKGGMGVAWNPMRSWIRITRIQIAKADSKA